MAQTQPIWTPNKPAEEEHTPVIAQQQQPQLMEEAAHEGAQQEATQVPNGSHPAIPQPTQPAQNDNPQIAQIPEKSTPAEGEKNEKAQRPKEGTTSEQAQTRTSTRPNAGKFTSTKFAEEQEAQQQTKLQSKSQQPKK
jgi:hypothetical protein